MWDMVLSGPSGMVTSVSAEFVSFLGKKKEK